MNVATEELLTHVLFDSQCRILHQASGIITVPVIVMDMGKNLKIISKEH
jgi:hypothetical protein